MSSIGVFRSGRLRLSGGVAFVFKGGKAKGSAVARRVGGLGSSCSISIFRKFGGVVSRGRQLGTIILNRRGLIVGARVRRGGGRVRLGRSRVSGVDGALSRPRIRRSSGF